MQYGIIKTEIIGRFGNSTKLTSEQGYCFYDVDAEERNYLTTIFTPITDEAELERKFKIVYGDAEKLNEEVTRLNEEQSENIE